MSQYDQQLKLLQERCARKRRLTAQAEELRKQYLLLQSRADELMGIKLSEQADVDKLEGRSLAAFFYNVVGKMDERLDKERQEAYAAAVKYDAAARELELVKDDIARCNSELSTLRNCEAEYEAVKQEKAAAIKNLGGAVSEEIMATEEALARLAAQETELNEAIIAGNSALRCAQDALSSLSSAENWGTWDMFGGGLISHLAKHEHLDEAQSSIESLQSALRRFKTELADINIHSTTQVTIEGFLRFADYFFDGLFADWAVLDSIHNSQRQVQDTRDQIESTLQQLQQLLANIKQERSQQAYVLETLIQNTKL